jgi:hypothetical protein
MQRRRFKQILTFPGRLANEAARLRQEADKLPEGPERASLLQKAQQADDALRMDQWLRSPGLQSPK